MGSLFTAKGTGAQKTSSSSTPTFATPEAQKTLGYLTGQLTSPYQASGQESYMQGLGSQGLIRAFNDAPATVDASGLVDNIKRASDSQTQLDIANARSKFYNRPTGRNDIAVADTVARNAATRDAALSQAQLGTEQFNANAVNEANRNRANLSQYLSTYSDADKLNADKQNAQALQLLAMLRGENSTGVGSSNTTNTGTPFQNILGALGAIGGGMAMCWVARAAFDNNPVWMVYREHMMTRAPLWYQLSYLTFGPAVAQIVKRSEWLKAKVRKLMLPAIRGIISN